MRVKALIREVTAIIAILRAELVGIGASEDAERGIDQATLRVANCFVGRVLATARGDRNEGWRIYAQRANCSEES